jgi:hypothetical protein
MEMNWRKIILKNKSFELETLQTLQQYQESFSKLSTVTQRGCIDWLVDNVIKSDYYNRKHTLTDLMNVMQRQTNITLSVNEFKGLMFKCGYLPDDITSDNPHYKVSQKSKAFHS